MSNYFNDQGEPMLTAAAARFEAYLDADVDVDAFYNAPVDEDYYYDHPDECPHDNGTYVGSLDFASGDFRCDDCDNIVGKWVLDPATGWPERV